MTDIFDLSVNNLDWGWISKTMIFLLMFGGLVAYEYYSTHISANYNIVGTPMIIFNCNTEQCGPSQTILNITNNQISRPLIVNATYSCNCTISDGYGNSNIFTYSPNITYLNGTYVGQHIVQPNSRIILIATAYRISGFDNVTIHISTTVI